MEKESKFANANAEKILEAAWMLFQKKGYRGVSMDELCLQCAITKPTLYYYFKDKEELFVHVLVHKLQTLRPAFQQTGSLEERLACFAAALLDNFQAEYTGLVHDREHIQREESRTLIRDTFRNEMFEPVIEMMKSGVKDGTLANEDPHSLALIFFGITNNFIGRAEELKQSNAALSGQLTHYFLKGVSKRE
jgi:TetR/AcrR family transcriptional regulator